MYNKIQEKLLIDRDKVGMVIGRGGGSIQRVQFQSQAKINIISKNVQQPYANIKGTKKQVEQAKSLILDLMNRDIKIKYFRYKQEDLYSDKLVSSYESYVDLLMFQDIEKTRRPNQNQYYLSKQEQKDNDLCEDFQELTLDNKNDYQKDKIVQINKFLSSIQETKHEICIYVLFGKFLFYEKNNGFFDKKQKISNFKNFGCQSQQLEFYYHNQFFYEKQILFDSIKKFIDIESKKTENKVTIIAKDINKNKIFYVKLQKQEKMDKESIEIEKQYFSIIEATHNKQRIHFLNFYNHQDEMDFRLYLVGNQKVETSLVKDILKNFDLDFDNKKVESLSKDFQIEEIRFINREQYKLKDSDKYFLIDKITCKSQDTHYQLELHDKDISVQFTKDQFEDKVYREKIQQLIELSEKMSSCFNFNS